MVMVSPLVISVSISLVFVSLSFVANCVLTQSFVFLIHKEEVYGCHSLPSAFVPELFGFSLFFCNSRSHCPLIVLLSKSKLDETNTELPSLI